MNYPNIYLSIRAQEAFIMHYFIGMNDKILNVTRDYNDVYYLAVTPSVLLSLVAGGQFKSHCIDGNGSAWVTKRLLGWGRLSSVSPALLRSCI